MKLLIEILIIITIIIPLASAQAYDFHNSTEYRMANKSISLTSASSSSSTQYHEMLDTKNSDNLTVRISSRFAGGSGVPLLNHSAGNNSTDGIGNPNSIGSIDSIDWFGRSEARLFLKNRSNSSSGLETIKFNISSDPAYNPIGLIIKQDGMQSEMQEGLQDRMTDSQYQNSTIIVHAGESIQDAVDAASSGDAIEIDSGTYNENLRIDKPLTVRGADAGRGLPVIDAGGRGNAIEISADHVILESIISTNASLSAMKPGAGIKLNSVSNCSLGGIQLYNNYYGISLSDSNNNTISDCDIRDNQYAIRMYFSNNNTVKNCEIRDNDNPLNIVSSEGNLISGNAFAGNSHEVEASKDNKIKDNKENFIKDLNESKEAVELNAKPRPLPAQPNFKGKSKSSHSSGNSGNGAELQPPSAYDDNGKAYNNLAQKAAGTLIFNPPDVMTAGKSEWIDARIGLENTSALVQGLLGKGEIQYRDVNIETNMTYVVKLESDSGFEIQAKRPDAQVLGRDPAMWLWSVTPLKEGNHTLILSVDLQLERPPFNCRCMNVTYWPVSVSVLEQEPQQAMMSLLSSTYSLTTGLIAFMASIFSLIILIRKFRKKED
jgi:parallel beta-helix repeat protein